MCRILMNNEFLKITLIELSQVDVSKKYKMNTGACQLLYTGAFVWYNSPMRFYDLWALQKYHYELEQSVFV